MNKWMLSLPAVFCCGGLTPIGSYYFFLLFQAAQWIRAWRLGSVHNPSSVPLLHSHSLPLLPYGSVPWGPSPGSKLPQHGSPTGGSSPQTPCSCVGSSPRAAAPARGLLLRGLSMGRSLLQATSTCSTGDSSTGCSVEIRSMWEPWAAGGQPAPPGASPQAAGELWLRAWSAFCPPSALTLGAAGLFCTPLSPS